MEPKFKIGDPIKGIANPGLKYRITACSEGVYHLTPQSFESLAAPALPPMPTVFIDMIFEKEGDGS